MRLAIGAGRGRIVRQLLTEAGVLAVLSCGAGLLVADGLMRLLRQFPAALGLTLALDLHIESRALAFCIALSAFAILLFGLAPALQTARLAVMPSLKGSGNASAGGRHEWFRGALVALQAAFAMVLLVGGGLYGRTLWKAYSTDLGFRSDHLLTAAFSLPPPGNEAAEQMWRAQRSLLARLSATPGVVSSALSSTGILSPGYPQVRIETGPDSAPVSAASEYVSRDFLKTMGIPLFAGEDFSARGDEAGAVAIVNRTLARSLAPGADPGRQDDSGGDGGRDQIALYHRGNCRRYEIWLDLGATRAASLLTGRPNGRFGWIPRRAHQHTAGGTRRTAAQNVGRS